MEDSTSDAGGLPPGRPAAPPGLAEILPAHALAARVVEAVLALHPAVPDRSAARSRVSPLLTEAGELQSLIEAELRARLDGDLTSADLELMLRHADALHRIRPGLSRYVDRLLMAALARRAGLAAAA